VLCSRVTAKAGIKADLSNFSWLVGDHADVLRDILRGTRVLQLPSRTTQSAVRYILLGCFTQDFSSDLFCGFLAEAGTASCSKK